MDTSDATHLAADLEARAVSAGGGTVLDLGDQRFYIKVSAKDSGGQFSLIEIDADPQAYVPPHLHTREAESFYIVEGQFEFFDGEKNVSVAAGDTVFMPPNAPHAWRCTTEGHSRMLILLTPGANFEAFAQTMAERRYIPEVMMTDPGKVDEFIALAGEHGIQLAPPPE